MNSRHLIAAGAFAFALACSGTPGTQLSVSAKTVQDGTTSASASLDLGNGISLDRIRVVVRKLKLEGQLTPAAGASAADSGGRTVRDADDDGLTRMEKEGHDEAVLGPFVVDLAGADLAGGLQPVVDAYVPAGTYQEIKFVVGPLRAPPASGAQALSDMAAKNASVVLDGTIADASGARKAFSFVSSLCAEVEKESELVVGGGQGDNLTLTVDPGSWFAGSGGAALDPSDPANQRAIEANIKASIDAFEDDDRHGDDDHGHGDGHHGGGADGHR